jgi:quercetin dioxygenase-like cupin family protein
MRTWPINELTINPGQPEILVSNDDARVIAISLAAGTALEDHQVHERAWLVLVAGEVTVTSLAEGGESVDGGVGLLVEFEPAERHRVDARADSRFLLVLTPWPGPGHPGALSLDEKATVRDRAAEQNRPG